MVQTYTPETPIEAYRTDFLHRGALCLALGKKYPALGPVAQESEAVVAGIDGKRADLRHAEDDLVRARAFELAEKLDVVDAYGLLRKQFEAYDKGNLFAFLPVAPSVLAKTGTATFDARVSAALTNLGLLPQENVVRKDFVPALTKEFGEFQEADRKEDEVRRAVAAIRLGLLTYRAELAAARDRQLGRIQEVVGSREKASHFTLPWRPTGAKAEEAEAPPAQEGGAQP